MQHPQPSHKRPPNLGVRGGTKPKVGKSSLARDLAYCIATGQPFLSRRTEAGRVLYLALEESPSDLQDKWRRMRLPDDCAGNVLLYPDGPCSSDSAVAWLEEAAEQFQPTLIIIDTLFRFVRIADENRYSEATRAMYPVLRLARTFNIAVLFLHHARKSGGENGDGMLGSTGYFGSVDVGIDLVRDPRGKRFITSEGRFGTPFDSHEVVMDSDSGLCAIGETVRETAIESMTRKIVEVLAKRGPTVRGDLEKQVSGNKTLLPRAVERLVQSGVVRKSGGAKKGDPFVFELTQPSLLSDS